MTFRNLAPIINKRINELLGLHYREAQYGDLERKLIHTAHALKIDPAAESVYQWICRADIPHHELEILAHHLTVCETYFFREKLALNLLAEKILPEIVGPETNSGKKKLIIWSAGCSSGEEPYSIAMTLKESLADFHNCDLTILATDVNTKALDKAKQGVYTPWSFRETPDYLKAKYFTKKGNCYSIKPEIKQMVQFQQLNLATDDFSGVSRDTLQMDVIFCRNVLMYLSPEVISRITGKFYDCLKKDAWLITGQVELNDEYFRNFQRVMFGNGIFYRKTTPAQQKKEPLNIITPLTAGVYKNRSGQISGSSKKPIAPKSSSAKTINKRSGSTTQKKVSNDKNVHQGTDLIVEVTKLANAGNLEDAEAMLRQWLKAKNAGAEHFFLYATILMEQNQWEAANDNLRKALYLDPEYLAARFSRSQVLKSMGRDKEAKKEMHNLIENIDKYDDEEPLPTLAGMTAGRVRQMANLLTQNGT